MKYQQEVTYIDLAGNLRSEVFVCDTGQEAMAVCRLKYPGCKVTGAGRKFL